MRSRDDLAVSGIIGLAPELNARSRLRNETWITHLLSSQYSALSISVGHVIFHFSIIFFSSFALSLCIKCASLIMLLIIDRSLS